MKTKKNREELGKRGGKEENNLNRKRLLRRVTQKVVSSGDMNFI